MLDPLAPLSPRERQIVQYTREGFTTAEIARRLVVSVSIVQAHMARIRSKLDPGHRADPPEA
jgi:DNA-binding CsgD family transcriptional regulator